MGGSSTSQTAVLRDHRTNSSTGFDLRSWQGLTAVLQVGKESLKDSASYSEFRNLILQYAQNGGDVELRKKVEAMLQTFTTSKQGEQTNVVPVSTEQTQEKKVVVQTTQTPPVTYSRDLGNRRVQPRFSGTSVNPQVHEPEREKEKILRAAPVLVSEVKESESASLKTEVEIHVDNATPTVSAPDVSMPISSIIPEAPVFKSIEEYKARISEIKRLVNARVGNPAMLIDTHNDHGKKYMTALLTALKATGGGSAADVDSVMMQLEESAQAILEGSNASEEVPSTEDDIIEEKSSESVMPHEEVTPLVAGQESDIPSEPVSPAEHGALQEKKEKMLSARQNFVSSTRDVLDEVRDVPKKDIPFNKYSAESTLAALLKHDETPVAERGDVSPNSQAKISEQNGSLAIKDQPLMPGSLTHREQVPPSFSDIRPNAPRPIIEGNTVRPSGQVSPVVQQSELFTPQITQMLDQLLHEWSIFAGSGLFGMGPSGSLHPLYKTLAPLSMGEVVAGRWEKADPKITKVIKQYVDAWRHEQGVAYTINETFEHYLRRVVQRILKRQSGT